MLKMYGVGCLESLPEEGLANLSEGEENENPSHA
jgi:hypothetical protein